MPLNTTFLFLEKKRKIESDGQTDLFSKMTPSVVLYSGILKTSWGFKNYGDYYDQKVDYYVFNMSRSNWERIFETMSEIDADYDVIDEMPEDGVIGNFFEDLSKIYFGLEGIECSKREFKY